MAARRAAIHGGFRFMSVALRARLARRLPFYYGWVVFAIACGANFTSRPLMSVAVLSVFVVPMTEGLGWSRGLFAGAVSLGGLCAVALSPVVGRWIDRYGSGMTIGLSTAVAGLCGLGLAVIKHVWAFYALYVPGRMVFASPLELATTTAISNWFIRRRALALALFGVTQGVGLAAMPMVAQLLITGWGWRSAWTTLACYTLAVGIVPALVLTARRPEDMGLEADAVAVRPPPSTTSSVTPPALASPVHDVRSNPETNFTLRQALRTRAFWVLSAFSAAGFMVQAGVSLHQVSHYIRQGLPGPQAAIMASVFALAQVPAGLAWSALTRRLSIRVLLALSGLSVALGAAGTAVSTTLPSGVVSASFLGVGVGGLHLLLRLAWADYYGRQHLGIIRGVTLPIQIGGQALGPVSAGMAFDATGSYDGVFLVFASAVTLASFLVLTAVPPLGDAE